MPDLDPVRALADAIHKDLKPMLARCSIELRQVAKQTTEALIRHHLADALEKASLYDLATQAVEAIKLREGEDVNEWATRMAKDIDEDVAREDEREKRIADALEDSERLDWLERDGDIECAMPVRDPETKTWWIYFNEAERDVEDASTLRAAIDAARSEPDAQGGEDDSDRLR